MAATLYAVNCGFTAQVRRLYNVHYMLKGIDVTARSSPARRCIEHALVHFVVP